jgi:pilus assembly protein CpaB
MFKKKSTKDMVRPESDSAVAVETKEKPKKERKQKEPHIKEKKEKRPLKDYFRNKSFLGGIFIVAALLIAFVVSPLIQHLVTAKTVSVVELKQNITAGDIITADKLTLKTIMACDVPDSAVSNIDDAVGKYVKVSGCAGDVLTSSRLSNDYPGDDPQLANIPDGKFAISVSMETLAQSVSGKLRAGDVIQIFASFKDTENKNQSADYDASPIPELKYVEVLSVSNSDVQEVTDNQKTTSDTDKQSREIATVTLLVNEEQASAVAGLENKATLHAALAARGDTAKKEALLTEQDKYFSFGDVSNDNAESASTEGEEG